MDSFYCPTAPLPVKKPTLEPSVPDVSLLLGNAHTQALNTYRGWKDNLQNKAECNAMTNSMMKKVRFNSPVSQNLTVDPCSKTNASDKIRHSERCDSATLRSISSSPPMNKVLKNKQFQEIYMANIPNQHLDLSLIDLVKPMTKHKNLTEEFDHTETHRISEKPSERIPTTYKEFLQMQQSENEGNKNAKTQANSGDYVTDIFNYQSPKNRSSGKLTTVNDRSESVKKFNNNSNPIDTENRNHIPGLNLNNSLRTAPQPPRNSVSQNTTCDMHKEIEVLPTQIKCTGYHKQKNDQVESTANNQLKLHNKCDSAIQTSIICQTTNKENNDAQIHSADSMNDDEPTVKDLLKIIQQQNEQLLLLQKQVAGLLDYKDRPKQIENSKINFGMDKYITNGDQADILNNEGSTPKKGHLPKFSIDLMTSFEVSFRPQQNMYQRKRDFILHEPKIQEITETESNDLVYDRERGKEITDSSLRLQEPISVRETCPSPEPSINIDMKDYESSDEDDDVGSTIGATFYKNLMNQVNQVIQNAQKQTNGENKSLKCEEMKNKTLNRVKDATVKHLRKIGMNFPTIDEDTPSNCSSLSDGETANQISFAVKQLLMKYLPDDQLAKFTADSTRTQPKRRSEEKIVLNSRRAPEFSFATVQFMKKYNLIAGDANDIPQKVAPKVLQPRVPRRLNDNNPKILDITALKQQPKLL